MQKIKLCEGLKNIYTIPCFQREYSWGEEEIEGLISDLMKVNDKEEYCLGVITVKDINDNAKLLIDGQQRLTTLYMIAIYCEYITECKDIKLSYEYDELISEKKSNNLEKILLKEFQNIPHNLEGGWQIINKKIQNEDKEKINKLIKSNLYYYEVNLDNKTNINHYFEVMNSRGVQLSKSDIIKSFFMNKLEKDRDKSCLNNLWYKLENMEKPINNIKNFYDIEGKGKVQYLTINSIINNKNSYKLNHTNTTDNKENYDKSILDFEYFLLYSIRLYKNKDKEDYEPSGEFNVDNLIDEYKKEFIDATSNEIIEYLNFLISIKNIYDKYIVKYDNNTQTWKLGIDNDDIKLIQSCLRVSFVNRRLMHWLYLTFDYFYNKKDINQYVEFMKNYIRRKYIKIFLDDNEKNNFRTGFNTPIIVLNYLDYLIKINYEESIKYIPELNEIDVELFTFKFRNSIEHFMPRHKEDGTLNGPWVDDFGNLAVLSYGTNTRMQNAKPDEKAKHFAKDLANYSLKLQIMTKIALATNEEWDEEDTKYITDKCIKLLKEDLDRKQM